MTTGSQKLKMADHPSPSSLVISALLVTLTLSLTCFSSVVATSFLRVADNTGGPFESATSKPATVFDCSVACSEKGVNKCLGFIWTPIADLSKQGKSTNRVAEEDKENCTKPALVGSTSKGRCGFLKCVPPPRYLTSTPGGQIYLAAGSFSPAYGSIKAPASYRMACKFAYRVYGNQLLTYADAEKKCAEDGAKLVTIKSPAQQRFLRGKVTDGLAYWIGLNDRKKEGSWILSDGSRPVYTNWDRGQPNNYMKDSDSEDQDCTMLFKGKWNDNQCSDKLRFICQIVFVEL